MSFAWKMPTSDASSAKRSLAQTKAEIDSYQEEIAKVDEYRATKERIEKKLGVIDRLERSRSGPVRIMDELAVHTPERLWLTRVSSREGSIVLEGMSLDYELVALFLTSLGRSPYFANVELEETKAAEVDGLKLNEFKLTASITDPGEGPAGTAGGTPVAMAR